MAQRVELSKPTAGDGKAPALPRGGEQSSSFANLRKENLCVPLRRLPTGWKPVPH
jgi:hypothetical protein